MPPQLLPFGEYLPDQPDFNNPGSATIKNVVPLTKDSYGPMPTPVAYSGALSARCQGGYSMTDGAGNAYVFAGDATKLYLLKAGSSSFADVSGPSAPYAVGAVPDGFWSATSFGERIVFTNGIDHIQTFLIGTDAAFSDLAAAAPKAKFCATVRDFLIVGHTVDGVSGAQPRRLWWPAIGDPTNWPTPGTNAAIQVQSDFQDLEQSDLGEITGLIGGALSSADGLAFCERGIYSIDYAGSPNIFAFQVLQGATGTRSPLSIVQRRLPTAAGGRGVVYYLGEDGFYATDGATSLGIGAQKIDKTFFRDLDQTYLGIVQGIADPINKLIYWLYSGSSSGGLFNRLLVYNWDLSRWALCDLTATPAEWATRSLTIGYTLDGLDSTGYNLDTLPFSLDSRAWTGGQVILSLFDSSHKLNYMTGPNMAPIVETSEGQLAPGRYSRILSTRPALDAAGGSVAVGLRNLLSDAVTYQAAVPVNIIGDCPQRCTGRYTRFQLTLPAGTAFNHLQGIEVNAVPEGIR